MDDIHIQLSILKNAVLLTKWNTNTASTPGLFSFLIMFTAFALLIKLLYAMQCFMLSHKSTPKGIIKVLLMIIFLQLFYILVMSGFLYSTLTTVFVHNVHVSLYAAVYLPLALCYLYFVEVFSIAVLFCFSIAGTVFIKNSMEDLTQRPWYVWMWVIYATCWVILFLYGRVCFGLLNVKKDSNVYVKV